MRPIFPSLLMLATVTSAQAQEPPAAEVAGVTVVARRVTPVAGVTVTANACPEPNAVRFSSDPAPAIIDSYPAQASVIAPGALILRATFSAPMSCYWAVTSESDGGDDPCQDSGSWALPARTTWTMTCKLKPSTHYLIRFGQPDGHGFVSRAGRPAPAYGLNFETSSAQPVGMEEARRLSAEGRTAAPVSAYVTCSAHPNNDGADCIRVAASPLPQSQPER